MMPALAAQSAQINTRGGFLLMARRVKNEQVKRGAFIEALEKTASVSRAAALAKVPRRTVYGWRDDDNAFATAWEGALQRGVDALEDEMIRRAHEGVLRPIFQNGKLVGHVREYSDRMLELALKRFKPKEYRENSRIEFEGHVTLEQIIAESLKLSPQKMPEPALDDGRTRQGDKS